MANYSEHPMQPLSELEVFIGYIVNATGSQTHRQRDRSQKLRDEFERIASWIMAQMRAPGIDYRDDDDDEAAAANGRDDAKNTKAKNHNKATTYHNDAQRHDVLELCLACARIGRGEPHKARRGRQDRELESFRFVAASALLREINRLENEGAGLSGGGYVGVRGRRAHA